MSKENYIRRFQAFVELLDLPVRAEQKRWTSNTRGHFPNRMYTYDDLLNRVNRVRSNSEDNVRKFIDAFRRKQLYPDLNPPTLNRHSGEVAPDFPIILTNPNPRGEVWYSMDGSDPRPAFSSDGSVSPTALQYQDPITVSRFTLIKARVKDGMEWSALNSAFFNGDIDALSAQIADYFDIAFYRRDGWFFSQNWLGDFTVRDFPWVFHFALGWFYAPGEEQEWLYHVELGWIWTSENVYPFFWSHRRQAWIFFLTSSGSGSELRWFRDFATGEWFSP